MGFTFKRPEAQFLKVTGASNGQEFTFVGKFITLDSDDQRSEMEARVDAAVRLSEENHQAKVFRQACKSLADDIFLGWANRPGDPESLWVTDEDGNPLDCTEEKRKEMLSRPSVAWWIVQAFRENEMSREVALGNSGRLPGNGFRRKVAEATRTRQT